MVLWHGISKVSQDGASVYFGAEQANAPSGGQVMALHASNGYIQWQTMVNASIHVALSICCDLEYDIIIVGEKTKTNAL